uniref:Plexin cytoplasmic RasGAP domain-containing protein n=1 Tax=Canis lupus familiaris TaxID=9615 RepID=A0A8C0TA54_CANLF
MTPLSEQEMNAHLAEESRKYQNEFNTNVAMAEIYKYAKRYRTQLLYIKKKKKKKLITRQL